MIDLAPQQIHLEELPSFAAFLLKNHIDNYTSDLIRLSYEVDVPLLKFLKDFSDEEIFQLSKNSGIEFLTSLSQNDMQGHSETSTQKWLANQLPIIKKLDVVAEDITLINFVRGKTLKKWIPFYAKEMELILKLYNEVDDLVLYYNTISTNAYIKILKQNIEEGLHFSNNIINASPGITFIYDLVQRKEIYINGRVEEVTGFTPEEVTAKTDLIAALTHPDDMEGVSSFLISLVEDKEANTHVADYRFRNKSGNYIWLRCYAVVYKRDEAGRATQILGTSFEITREKETAKALARREQQLLEAQSISKIGSYEWDLLTDTSTHSPELAKIFENHTGVGIDRWMEKVHPDDVEKIQTAIAESFKTGTFTSEFRYEGEKQEKVILSKGSVVFDKEKKPVTLIGTVQDITERKRIEEDLITNSMELQRSNTQLEEFAFVASHDLKEPLRKISMYSNIILRSEWDKLPEKTKINIEKISDASERMQKLIEGILSYSLLEKQSYKEKQSLDKLLKEAIQNLDYKIQETKAVIRFEPLPEAYVIPYQVQQLFQNLIGNALKFCSKNQPAEVVISHTILPAHKVNSKELRTPGCYIQIDVTDNGIGFDNESAQKIFGLFKRLHTRAEYEGSGLGLAICKKIVENHGGLITAHSQTGIGSTFTVILPLDH
jgi:PAS domain S-box-containing protein